MYSWALQYPVANAAQEAKVEKNTAAQAYLASFPGPTQLSVASSMVKRERAWCSSTGCPPQKAPSTFYPRATVPS